MRHNSAHNSTRSASVVPPGLREALHRAEQEYVRYFDLFSNVYYLNNFQKRELTARRYALLKRCHELIEAGAHTTTDVFRVYKTFEAASITHYNSFLRKMRELRTEGHTTCTHGRIGQKYAYKLNPYTNTVMFQLLCDPHYYSCSQIAGWVNAAIQRYNAESGTNFSTISASLVSHHSVKFRNEISYYRDGKRRFDTAVQPYLPRITALSKEHFKNYVKWYLFFKNNRDKYKK